MSTRNLDKLMTPQSVVAIGASERPGSVGAAVTRNLLGAGFAGEIHLVNRKGGEISGRPVWRSVGDLLSPPESFAKRSRTSCVYTSASSWAR